MFDLSSYPVANAVMAWSAVPAPVASIGLRKHDDCSERHRLWVADALTHDDFPRPMPCGRAGA